MITSQRNNINPNFFQSICQTIRRIKSRIITIASIFTSKSSLQATNSNISNLCIIFYIIIYIRKIIFLSITIISIPILSIMAQSITNSSKSKIDRFIFFNLRRSRNTRIISIFNSIILNHIF